MGAWTTPDWRDNRCTDVLTFCIDVFSIAWCLLACVLQREALLCVALCRRQEHGASGCTQHFHHTTQCLSGLHVYTFVTSHDVSLTSTHSPHSQKGRYGRHSKGTGDCTEVYSKVVNGVESAPFTLIDTLCVVS